MGGEWHFSFKFQNKATLDVSKYQQLLLKLRQEFEPQFSVMDSTEGAVKWTNLTVTNVPVNNEFAKFSYRCTKEHIVKGPEHGVWKLLWDPTQTIVKSNIHARCAPTYFKELSNKIQEKLVEEFPDHFHILWRNGMTGYEGCIASGTNQRFEGNMNDIVKQMMVAMKWNDSDSDDGDRCIHHIPWAYCCDCSDDMLEMNGY